MNNAYEEKREHPQKIYYIHTKKKTLIADNYFIYSDESKPYYSIDSRHTRLIALSKNLPAKIQQCEDLFQTYISAVLSENTSDAVKTCQEIVNALTEIHPFFTDKSNTSRYIQEKIKYYFKVNLSFHLPYTDESENHKYVQKLFEAAMQPTVTIPSSVSCDTLWSEFFHLVNPNKDSHAFSKSTANIEQGPTKFKILQSLFTLEHTLTKYLETFYSMIDQYKNKLTKAFIFTLFLSQPYAHILSEEITKTRKIVDPDTMYHILIKAMAQNYKTIDTNELIQTSKKILIEQNETILPEILDEQIKKIKVQKEEYNRFICIETADATFDRITLNVNERLQSKANIPNRIFTPSYSAYLERIINSNWDKLFETEIYEVYTFEQLIYLELYHMAHTGEFIRKCANPNCKEHFITHSHQKIFCKECSSSRRGVNSKYSYDHKNDYYMIRNRMYQQDYYRLKESYKSLHPQANNGTPKKPESLEKLGAWRDSTTKKIKEILRQEDSLPLEQYVEILRTKYEEQFNECFYLDTESILRDYMQAVSKRKSVNASSDISD